MNDRQSWPNCPRCPGNYRHWRSRVYVTAECPSVRPSVCPIDRQQQQRPAGLLLSGLRAAGAVQQAQALSSECGRRHVDSHRKRLTTDLQRVFRDSGIYCFRCQSGCEVIDCIKQNPVGLCQNTAMAYSVYEVDTSGACSLTNSQVDYCNVVLVAALETDRQCRSATSI